ncbi:hypothetical protein [Ruminococcus sp. FC2018]|nr:hypothetical protein [Ruminococcus sp. FC2018]
MWIKVEGIFTGVRFFQDAEHLLSHNGRTRQRVGRNHSRHCAAQTNGIT